MSYKIILAKKNHSNKWKDFSKPLTQLINKITKNIE